MKPKHIEEDKAGIVLYRYVPDGEPRLLLVSSRKVKDSWVFPVGTVEPGESLEATAMRECMEESGYLVNLGARLQSVRFRKGERHIRYTFFMATEGGEVDDWETDRERQWVPISKVFEYLPEVFHEVAGEAARHLVLQDVP